MTNRKISPCTGLTCLPGVLRIPNSRGDFRVVLISSFQQSHGEESDTELSRICGKKTLLHKNHIFEGVGVGVGEGEGAGVGVGEGEGVGEWGRALGCGREPRLRT